jgi:hypothetical protein
MLAGRQWLSVIGQLLQWQRYPSLADHSQGANSRRLHRLLRQGYYGSPEPGRYPTSLLPTPNRSMTRQKANGSNQRSSSRGILLIGPQRTRWICGDAGRARPWWPLPLWFSIARFKNAAKGEDEEQSECCWHRESYLISISQKYISTLDSGSTQESCYGWNTSWYASCFNWYWLDFKAAIILMWLKNKECHDIVG